jgi:hypothetical protein
MKKKKKEPELANNHLNSPISTNQDHRALSSRASPDLARSPTKKRSRREQAEDVKLRRIGGRERERDRERESVGMQTKVPHRK